MVYWPLYNKVLPLPKPPPRKNRADRYAFYMDYLLSIPPNWHTFEATYYLRKHCEYFIDKESRKNDWPPRESEYALEHKLKTGTLRPKNIDSKSSYAKHYHSLLWLYSICAATELNPRLSIQAYADLEQWKDARCQ